jgi:HK97 family phage prohead protease
MAFNESQSASVADVLGIDFEKAGFNLRDFTAGMNVELEHGTVNPLTNVTDDDPIQTGKIALYHLLETPLYYAPDIGLESWEEDLKKQRKSREPPVRQHKSLTFKMDSYEPELGVFEGYAAVFGNIDSYGDIIEPGAFLKTILDGMEANRIKILALHRDCDLPIGVPLEMREDERGLFIKGKISDTTAGRDVKALLADGVLTEMSIGYDPAKFTVDEDGIRHLTEIDLWEVSLVTWAANDQAKVTGYKAADDALRDIKAGRKISAKRLSALKEARDTLESIILEAEDEGKSVKHDRSKVKPIKTARKSRTVKIVY